MCFKDFYQENKKTSHRWEKIFANHISETRPDYIKNSYKLMTKGQITQFFKWAQDLGISSKNIYICSLACVLGTSQAYSDLRLYHSMFPPPRTLFSKISPGLIPSPHPCLHSPVPSTSTLQCQWPSYHNHPFCHSSPA